MKKAYSFLALLLAVIMLFASCAPNNSVSPESSPNSATTNSTVSEDASPDSTTSEDTTTQTETTTGSGTATSDPTTSKPTTSKPTTSKTTTSKPTTSKTTTSKPTTSKNDTPTEPQPKPRKILAIGNSFSIDAMEHLAEILTAEGYTDFILGNLYVGGCSLNRHKNLINSGAPSYDFHINTGNGWSATKRNIEYGLTYADWDVITIQQVSGYSGIPGSYSDLQYIVDFRAYQLIFSLLNFQTHSYF